MELRKMRETSGLTQAELSRISGVNLRSLQDYEQGHKPIQSAKGETLLRLSRALGYTIEDILKDSTVEIDINVNDKERIRNRISAYEKCILNRKMNRVRFPIVANDDYVDMSAIYPTKQILVKQVVNRLRSDGRVLTLRLFGSSISMACHKDSDLDFAVEISNPSTESRNEISEMIQEASNWGADIIWLDRLKTDERIYKDIMRGLVLI